MANDTFYRLLRANGSLTTNKNLIFGIGLNEAILFSELISRYYYFEDKKHLQEDKSFFNTVDDLYLGTGIGERAQRTAINNLKKLNLLAVKNKGVPPKRYFKINFDSDLIETYLIKGENIMADKREVLREKHERSIANSTIPSFAVLKNCNIKELNNAEGRSNNTKLNHTKPNNTKERYIILADEDYSYIQIFKEAFTNRFNKLHKSVTVDNLILLKQWCKDLASIGVEYDIFKEIVEEYLDELNTDTKGNILYFMSISMRMLGVEPPTIAI